MIGNYAIHTIQDWFSKEIQKLTLYAVTLEKRVKICENATIASF